MGIILVKKTKGWFAQENVYVKCEYQIVTLLSIYFVRRENGDNGACCGDTRSVSYEATCVLLAFFGRAAELEKEFTMSLF